MSDGLQHSVLLDALDLQKLLAKEIPFIEIPTPHIPGVRFVVIERD